MTAKVWDHMLHTIICEPSLTEIISYDIWSRMKKEGIIIQSYESKTYVITYEEITIYPVFFISIAYVAVYQRCKFSCSLPEYLFKRRDA